MLKRKYNILVLSFALLLFMTAMHAADLSELKWIDLNKSNVASEKLIPEDGEEYDLFGISVSISGNRALIGSYRDDDNGLSSGSAYIFEFDGAKWNQVSKLKPNDGAEGDVFGYSVSIDGNRALIGAYLDDDFGLASGSAYVFDYDGNDWNQSAKLVSNDLGIDDWFGSAVSISGDWALVGAENDDDKGEDAGAAYLFKFDGNSWSQYAKLTGEDSSQADKFSNSLSLFGNRALIGSKNSDGSSFVSGAVYVFDFNGINWSQSSKLTPNDGSLGDLFGFSVSLSHDRALVGAHRHDYSFANSGGAAYVFDFDGLNWNESAKLFTDDANNGDRFGYSVSLNDNKALIGAPYEDDVGGDSGSAYLYEFDGNHWNQTTKLNLGGGAPDDRFGYSVGLSENNALISAYRDDDLGLESGSVCVIGSDTRSNVCGDLIFKDNLELN